MNYYEKQIQREIDKFNNFIENELTNSVPQEVREDKEFMNFFIKGYRYIISYKEFYTDLKPDSALKIKTVKDLQEYTGTTNHSKLLDIMKKKYNTLKNSTYDKELKRAKSRFLWKLVNYDAYGLIDSKEMKIINNALDKLNLADILSLEFITDVDMNEYDIDRRDIIYTLIEESKNGKIIIPVTDYEDFKRHYEYFKNGGK